MSNPVQIIHDADTIFYRIEHQHLGDDVTEYIGAISTYIENVRKKSEIAVQSIFPNREFKHTYCFGDWIDTGPRYRAQFDKEAIYKDNRKNAPKPKFISEMKEWVHNNRVWSIPVNTPWGETDDFVSVLANSYRNNGTYYVISSCDKDLMQIQGWHYNYLKDTVYAITEEEANRNFFKQLLTGDVGDNIPGLKGIGPKKAGYLLDGLGTVEEMWDATLIAYTNHYKDTMSDDEIAEILYERGNKLWLKRTEDQIWVPPIPE